MFEKFSAGAIQAINAAREEALRLEFNQVDTDHLLLGLMHERQGLAAKVLGAKGVEQRQLRLAVEQHSGRGYSLVRAEELVFSPETLRVLARTALARPTLVESQDLFSALLLERDCAARSVLEGFGLDPEDLREAVSARLAAQASDDLNLEDRPLLPSRFTPRLLTPAGHSVLGYAHAAATFFGHTIVGTEQLLTGLLQVKVGLASQVLAANGVDTLEVEAVASRVIGQGSGTVPGRLTTSRFCDDVLEMAWVEARRLGHRQVGTGHILLGLTELDVGGALYIMDHLNLNLAQIRDDVEQAFASAAGDPEPEEAYPLEDIP